jgi:hypothetical protein
MTAIAKKLRASRFLGSIVIAWGLVIVGHGLVQSWHAMLALRCLLGIFEAGFFSSCAYLLSTWYVRGESIQLPEGLVQLLTLSIQPRLRNAMQPSIFWARLLQASVVSSRTG